MECPQRYRLRGNIHYHNDSRTNMSTPMGYRIYVLKTKLTLLV